MAAETERKAPLIVALSSRTLFDLDESNRVFEEEGVEAYRQYQIAREDEPLEPGVAFPLVQKLSRLNAQLHKAGGQTRAAFVILRIGLAEIPVDHRDVIGKNMGRPPQMRQRCHRHEIRRVLVQTGLVLHPTHRFSPFPGSAFEPRGILRISRQKAKWF